MRTNLKVALRRMGLVNETLPLSQLEELASKYWTGEAAKEGRRYNLFVVFRYVVFEKYKDFLMPFVKSPDNKEAISRLMDKIAMDATNIAYAQSNDEDELKAYMDVLDKAINSKSPLTFTTSAAISFEIAKKYIRAREREYSQTLGGAIQRQLKQNGVR